MNKETLQGIEEYVKTRMDRFQLDDDSLPSERAAYDAYLNVLNEITKLKSLQSENGITPCEDGTVTDHELNLAIQRFIKDYPHGGIGFAFGNGFRLGQRHPIKQSDDVVKEIKKEISKTMKFLKDDYGQLDMKKDPMQTLSFTRGKQIGLNIALGIIEKYPSQVSEGEKSDDKITEARKKLHGL